MGRQGHGRRLTDKERMEIIELTRKNPQLRHVSLAAMYNVNESTIRKWRVAANAEKIEARYLQGVQGSRDVRQRGQAVKNVEFDKALYEWILAQQQQAIEVPPVRIREKARLLAPSYEGMEGFKASSGWYYRYCRRYGLPCPGSVQTRSADSLSEARAVVQQLQVPVQVPMAMPIPMPIPLPATSEPHQVSAPMPSLEPNELMQLHAAANLTTQPRKRRAEEININDEAAAEQQLLLNLGHTAAGSKRAKPLTVGQEAIMHLLKHHKSLMDVSSRLRFIKQLAHIPGEAEMYLVMDEDTRVEYIKDFIDKTTSGGMLV